VKTAFFAQNDCIRWTGGRSGLLEMSSGSGSLLLNMGRIRSELHFRLTPTEIRAANFLKEAKTTVEIAALKSSSARAIEFRRQNLRNKLGLKSNNSKLWSHFFSRIRSVLCGY
jgi:DNA-binding CsgD family transcriptional regulator